jgi:hypothetical protein
LNEWINEYKSDSGFCAKIKEIAVTFNPEILSRIDEFGDVYSKIRIEQISQITEFKFKDKYLF